MNLGPVRRMVDLNGHSNLVGEGMNTAERVMSFASPGEITASRAYCDAISCLRESYRRLFESLGMRADKHGREHEVFRVVPGSTTLEEARSSVGTGARNDGPEVPDHANKGVPSAPETAGAGRWGFARGAAVSAVVVAALGVTAAAWLAGEKDKPGVPRPAASPATLPEARPSPPEHVAPSEKAAAGSAAASSPAEPPPASRAERAADPARAALPPPPRIDRPAQRERSDPGDSSRCAALTQRAALGEALGPKDQEELRKSCR